MRCSLSPSGMFVVPVAVAPGGRWPSAAAITEFGTCQVAAVFGVSPSSAGGRERSTALTSTSIFGNRVARRPARSPSATARRCCSRADSDRPPRRRRVRDLVELRRRRARVDRAPAGARADLRHQPVAHARVHRELEAVPVLSRSSPKIRLLPQNRLRSQRVRRRRRDEDGHRIAATVGEPRILRRRQRVALIGGVDGCD